MSTITYFTKVQNNVEKWITDLGYRVRSEVDVENYRADLVINDLKLIVEVDGPSHKKIKGNGILVTNNSAKISKRDKLLLQYFENGIYHIPVDIEEENFKNDFITILKGLENEKRNK